MILSIWIIEKRDELQTETFHQKCRNWTCQGIYFFWSILISHKVRKNNRNISNVPQTLFKETIYASLVIWKHIQGEQQVHFWLTFLITLRKNFKIDLRKIFLTLKEFSLKLSRGFSRKMNLAVTTYHQLFSTKIAKKLQWFCWRTITLQFLWPINQQL